MPKVKRGRISGLYGMASHSARELAVWASEIEAQIRDADNVDDPKWLKRRADKLRALSVEKESAAEHKVLQNKSLGAGPSRRSSGSRVKRTPV
jgi:hypothetical protein